MLPITASTFRLFLHVLAATVWVGGQLTLAGLVPTVRGIGTDAPRVVARAFNRLAWPAFALLVVTGVWNLFAIDVGKTSTEYQMTLALKLIVVVVSGLAAAAHVVSPSRAVLAVGGALAGLSAIAALFLGILLHG